MRVIPPPDHRVPRDLHLLQTQRRTRLRSREPARNQTTLAAIATTTLRAETRTRPADPSARARASRHHCSIALRRANIRFHALLHDTLWFKIAKARIKKIIHETQVQEISINDLS